MAERTCPLCKKRPVWRTHHSNNWRHLCKRCYHKAWAANQKAQRAARRVTRDTGDAFEADLSFWSHRDVAIAAARWRVWRWGSMPGSPWRIPWLPGIPRA